MDTTQKYLDLITDTLGDMRKESKDEWEAQRTHNQQLLERLVKVETNMHVLAGNGKKGRVDDIDERLTKVEGTMNKVKGVGGFLAFLGLGGIVEIFRFHIGHK